MVETATRTVVFIEPIGRRLCLEFANTRHNFGAESSRDDLKSYADLVLWSQQAGIVNSRETEQLLRESRRCTKESAVVLTRALALRDAIHRIFSAIASERSPAVSDLDILNDTLSKALKHSPIVSTAEGFAWGWDNRENALDWMLGPVARSAAELLTSEHLHRVRECGGESCTWVFLDMSRNQSRHWCDMKSCGNRAKARRHYERTRQRRKKQNQ